MRSPAILVAAVLGALAGLGVGYLSFTSDPAPVSDQLPTIAASPVVAGAEAPPGTIGGAPLRIIRRERPAPAPGTAVETKTALSPSVEEAPEACKRWVEESVGLRTAVADLQARLDQNEQQRLAQQGESIEAPEDLDDAYRQSELLEHFGRALEETGIAAEVNTIDCSEYPCVVYGLIKDHEALDKLLGAPAMGAYRDASRDVSVWRSRFRDDGEEKEETHFGVALYPKDDEARGSEIGKRLRSRKRQMWEAIRPR